MAGFNNPWILTEKTLKQKLTYTYKIHIIMNVVWDIKKAAANIRNHGIEFSHGATVLDDPMAVTIEDTRHGNDGS